MKILHHEIIFKTKLCAQVVLQYYLRFILYCMIIMKLEENKNNTHEICRCHLDCQIYSPYEGALRARLYVKFVDAVRLIDCCI